MEEFKACWMECDANKDGVIDCEEFKVFAVKHNEMNKKRFGESVKGNEQEDEQWFGAYNSITSNKNGISMEDFKTGRGYLMEIMNDMRACHGFKTLTQQQMIQMSSFKPVTQSKIREAMRAENDNKKLFMEQIGEFYMCFNACDVNKNGVLELPEFKTFMDKMYEMRCKRFGEAFKEDDREKCMWYEAYNAINPSKDGISIECFIKGRGYIRKLMTGRALQRAKMMFAQLMKNAMKRMSSYKPETKAKIKEYMEAEEKNPTLFLQIMSEFSACWK